MMQKNITFLQYLKHITRTVFWKIQRLDLLTNMGEFTPEFFVIYNLKQALKLHHAFTRDVKDIILVKIPLNLEQAHKPRVWIFLYFQTHYPTRPTGFNLTL